jgi:hypothetical protein
MEFPKKIMPVNYGGFIDFTEDGNYSGSVINQDNYEEAELIGDEIARRYNTFPEWICVKDRLPDVDIIVQLWNNKWTIGKRVMVGETTLWHYEGQYRYTYEEPAYWMPIPEPPKP